MTDPLELSKSQGTVVSSQNTSKRKRESDKDLSVVYSQDDQCIMRQLMFPSDDELLGGVAVTTKKQKTCAGKNLLALMSNRLKRVSNNPDGFKPSEGPVEYQKSIDYLEPNEFGVQMVKPFTLFPYQKNVIRWMVEREEGIVSNASFSGRGFMLAMVMGLGKTLCTATLIARTLVAQRSQGSCTLYVCPKNLLGTVKYELHKFLGDQLRVLVLHKDFMKSGFCRINRQNLTQFDVIITNYGTVVGKYTKSSYCENKPKETKPDRKSQFANQFMDFPWFRIILDESHEIRAHYTTRFKSVQQLVCSRRICMTGTPIHNSIKDLYTQLKFCGLQLPHAAKQTKHVIRALHLMDMIKFVEYSDAETVKLPHKNIRTIFFELSYEEKFLHQFYIKHAQSSFCSIKDQTGKNRGRKTMEAHTRILRVMQICSAPYLITPASKFLPSNTEAVEVTNIFPSDPKIERWIQNRLGPSGVGSTKMNTFIQLINNIHNDTASTCFKTVVFANFTSTLRLAIDALHLNERRYKTKTVCVTGAITSSKIRDDLFSKFRCDPEVTVLFMTLKLGSVGLNLTEACNVVFIEPWYSHAALSQAEARVHRIGQILPVNIYYLIGTNSVEERVLHIANEKRQLATEIANEKDHRLGLESMEIILFNRKEGSCEIQS
jgi:SNF2 family DNA or RNA helicase